MSKEIVKVVGLSFRPVRVELKPKQLVTLLPEPDNKFDSDAVKVESDGVLLGYIGKTDPYRPTVLEAKEPIEVPISKVFYYKEGEDKLWDKVEVGDMTQLWLEVDVPSLKDNTYKYVTSLTGEKVQWSEFHHSCLDMDGNKLMGGSTYATLMTPQSNFEFIAKNYAKKNKLKEKQVLDYWDSLMNVAGDYGTSIHKAMEHYGKYEPIVGHDMALPRQRHLKQVVENFLLRSDMKNCKIEPLVTDVQMGMSGWIDLLRFVGEKKVWIEDYKTAHADAKKFAGKLKEYVHQLNYYGTILANHGYTVEKIIIWHWYDGNWTPYTYMFTPVQEYLRKRTGYTLPTAYSNIPIDEKYIVRNQYEELQNNLCYYCKESLSEEAPKRITDKSIDWSKFPENFLAHPVHLQHNHDTDMTEGAVHAYCNAVMWQYEGR